MKTENEKLETQIEHLNKPIPITMANIDQFVPAAGGGTTFLTEARTNPQPSQAEEIQVLSSNDKAVDPGLQDVGGSQSFMLDS